VTTDTATSEYRYERFRLRHMVADLRFDPDGLEPGDRVPGRRLPTVDGGGHVELGAPDEPYLLVFGSNTCPMTAAAAGPLQRLHDEFGDHIRFVVVEVREAHPGASLGQARTREEKAGQARLLHERLGGGFTVAVDDLDGSLHTTFDPKPNATYLVDADGRLVFRSIWASDERGLRDALASVVAGRAPRRSESRRMVGPLLASMGHIDGVLRVAGPGAARDLLRAAPPMLLAGRVASWFRWLPHHRRGPAVMSVVGLTLVVLAGWLLLR
jgi:hypothetical protein